MREVPISESKNLNVTLSKRVKILFLAAIGNCLELYDYTLYAVMLPFLVPVFFPSETQGLGMFFGYLSFGIAFFFAPLGAIFWGWFGDRFGRLKMLRLTMTGMAFSSLCIALMPGYAEVGLLAPILLILLRVIQGICASGEVKGAMIFALEHLGERYYGLTSGIITAGGAMGVLLAMFMAYQASISSDQSFWRVPFVIGSVLYLIAVAMRKFLTESKEYKAYQKNAEPISYLQNIVVENKSSSLVVFMLGGLLGVLSYMMHAFLSPYAISLGYSKEFVYTLSIYAYVATISSALITGYFMSNRMMSFMSELMLVIFITSPFYYFLMHVLSEQMLLVAYICFGINLGAFACISSVVMYKAFPAHIRCRGVLFNYALGVGIFGGVTPALMQVLSSTHFMVPILFIAAFTAIVKMIYDKEVQNVSVS